MTTTIQNIHLRLPALGEAAITFREHPRGGSADDPLVRAARAAVTALVQLDGHAQRIDGSAPVMQRRELLATDHAKAQLSTIAFRRAVGAARDRLVNAEARLYNPPAATSPADVALDVELRSWFREQGDTPQTWQQLTAGESPELLAALARFPAGVTSEKARAVYRALAAAAQPERVAAFATEAERVDWGDSIVAQLVGVLNGAINQLGVPTLLMDAETTTA